MSEFTTQLFLDVKNFEKYQSMLKKQVHLEQARSGEYELEGFPNSRNFHRVIRALGGHSEGLTNTQLIYDYDFRPSDLEDGIKALVSNKLATTEDINAHEYLVKLTDAGDKRAEKLAKRREEIAEAAYGSLSEDDQRELDRIVNKLVEDYKKRDVNYTALSDLI